MRHLAVLSPHRDDAVFSLSIALRVWCDAGVRVQVLNFFTRTAYAPRTVGSHDAAAVSDVRRREDRLALRSLHRQIQVRDYDLVDAPLRLGLATPLVMDLNAASVRDLDVASIANKLSRDYTVAPLGLGGHVDHRTVRDAAIGVVSAHRLAFYEDLPYATWTAEVAILSLVGEIEDRVKRKLRPLLVRSSFRATQIRRLAGLYPTQVAPEDAAVIAAFPAKYRNRTRIWVPEHSAGWLAIGRLGNAAS